MMKERILYTLLGPGDITNFYLHKGWTDCTIIHGSEGNSKSKEIVDMCLVCFT